MGTSSKAARGRFQEQVKSLGSSGHLKLWVTPEGRARPQGPAHPFLRLLHTQPTFPVKPRVLHLSHALLSTASRPDPIIQGN